MILQVTVVFKPVATLLEIPIVTMRAVNQWHHRKKSRSKESSSNGNIKNNNNNNDTASSLKGPIEANSTTTNTEASSAAESLIEGENHNYIVAVSQTLSDGTTTSENESMNYDCVPSSTNSTADTTVRHSASPETKTPVDEPVINSVTTQTNLHIANPIAHLNEIFEKNDNVSTESSKRKLTSRKYSLRKSTLASRYSNSLPQKWSAETM